MIPAAQEQPVLAVAEFVGDLFDLLALLEHALDLVGDRAQAVDHLLALRLAHELSPAEEQRQHRQHDALAGERLGAGDADLRPGVQVDAAVGLAGDRAADDVDDAQRQRALFLGFAQGRQRVGGLAGLADRDHHRVLFDDRIAIAELAGVGAFGDHLGQIFHQVIADQPRVPRGALAGQDEPLGLHQLARVIGQPAQDDPPLALLGPPAQAVAHGVGLLEDLLEHVVLVVAQLVFLELVLQLLMTGLTSMSSIVMVRKLVRLQHGHLVVVEIDHLRGVLDDRRWHRRRRCTRPRPRR